MTEKYIFIYQDVFRTKLPEKRTLGIVLKGYYPNVPPTAYVRLIDWQDEFEQKTNLKVEFIPWHELLTYKINVLNKVIIQRDAIPSYAVNWCIDALKLNGVPFDYEMDDNLLNVPEVIDTDGVYKKYKNHFIRLIEHADAVHVTNNSLASVVKVYNSNVIVRPNKIFPHRWNTNIASEEKIELLNDLTTINIIYFGSRTHQEDLDFLVSIIDAINSDKINVHLYIIGCGDVKENEYITRLVPPSSRYDLFVNWLIRIAHNFDLGVAPLVDVDFAHTKSPLKAIELLALNLPVICSDIPPYTELKKDTKIKNYKKLKFVENNIESWCDEILKIKGSSNDKT